jgi:hypothetical protein
MSRVAIVPFELKPAYLWPSWSDRGLTLHDLILAVGAFVDNVRTVVLQQDRSISFFVVLSYEVG